MKRSVKWRSPWTAGWPAPHRRRRHTRQARQQPRWALHLAVVLATAVFAAAWQTVADAADDGQRSVSTLAPVGSSIPAGDYAAGYSHGVRVVFARAAQEVAEAYFVTERNFEPRFNAITVKRVAPAVALAHPLLSKLVRPASRRQLSAADAFSGHLGASLETASTCGLQFQPPNTNTCDVSRLLMVPSMQAGPDGALEQLAAQRVAGTPIKPFDLLSAAFEVAAWRPAGIHPMVAEAARNAASMTRIRSRDAGRLCDVSALWVAAALTADIPDVRAVHYGLWHADDRLVDLRAAARTAAQRGCRAARYAERTDPSAPSRPIDAPATGALVFWDLSSVMKISALAGPRIVGTLDVMTAGALPAPGSQPVDPDAAAAGVARSTNYRGCDAVSHVVPLSAVVNVRGIGVHRCLADSLRELLTAASADGVTMSGWGWRSTTRQIQLRRQYCPLPFPGSTNYWRVLSLLDAAECTPPVSKPTTSRHEYGLAVDFNCGPKRASITSASRCFAWLKANAHRYGMYNLPSEPWHWSINGR